VCIVLKIALKLNKHPAVTRVFLIDFIHPSIHPSIHMAVVPWPASIGPFSTTPDPSSFSPGIVASIQGPATGNDTADFNSESVIQRGYVINPFLGDLATLIIPAGHPVFCYRGRPEQTLTRQPGVSGSAINDNQSYTILHLAAMNFALQRNYENAIRDLSAHLDLTQGLANAESETLSRYLLSSSEASWADLFADGAVKMRSDKMQRHLFSLCERGILSQWNYLGISNKASAPDDQTVHIYTNFPINVIFKGTRKFVANVWGENAGQAANLFLILKRRFDPTTGEYGGYAFHPYATNSPNVPMEARHYKWYNGADVYGTVIPVGFVRDSRKMTLAEAQLQILQGISPRVTASAIKQICEHEDVPTLDVAIHPSLRQVYNGF
jgi:hypothetical protein